MKSDSRDEAFDLAPSRAAKLSGREALRSDDPEFPYVVKADVGRLPDGNIGLRLTFAENEEAYQSQAWHEVAYLLGPATARELAARLA